MPKQTVALAYTRPADALDESQYLALVQALSESARGRAFLAEHARRSRGAETKILLAAIERIEAQVRPPPPDPIYNDLRRVIDDLRTARDRAEAGGKVPKAEQLSALLDLLLRRLGKLLPGEPAADTRRSAAPTPAATAPAAAPRPAVVRWLEEPLKPAPAVNDATPPPRPTGHVATAAGASAPRPPPVAERQPPAPRKPPVAEHQPPAPTGPTIEIEAGIKAVVDAKAESRGTRPPLAAAKAKLARAAAAASPKDALAAIMALSEEERIALFS